MSRPVNHLYICIYHVTIHERDEVLEVCGARQDGGGGEAVGGHRGRGLLVRERHHHAQQLLAPPRRQRHGPGHGSCIQAQGSVEPYLDITVAQAFLCGLITDI